VVVVLAEVVVGDPTEAMVVVVDGNTGLIGCTVAPAQPTSRMSAAKRPGSLFIRLNLGTAHRLTGLEGQRIGGRPLQIVGLESYALCRHRLYPLTLLDSVLCSAH
jgi:hypothetical protein